MKRQLFKGTGMSLQHTGLGTTLTLPILLIGMLASLNEVYAASVNSGGRLSINSQPELQVTAQLQAKPYHAADGSLCYELRPRYKIMNKGQSAALNFRFEADWKISSNNWSLYETGQRSVGAGQSIQWIEGATSAESWCVKDQWIKPGFRIRVDTLHQIGEINEGNNTAVIFFTPGYSVPLRPHTIRKLQTPGR